MICLEELSTPGVCEIKAIPFRSVPDPGYVHVQIQDPAFRRRWQGYISKRKENLKPDTLLKKFNNLIDEALMEKKETFPRQLSARFSDGAQENSSYVEPRLEWK
ncbi:hypothetical protein OS493_007178 [Desmophyllum pertusum]|uniref:Uncharacterized protein n=1 Tax=Desmophyllum pertusum TaxID=174260 RepID=A0A9W9ZFZ1_9CNID|nr:hypothetical protein OS493_007178 [Desmophyllum pertusum]